MASVIKAIFYTRFHPEKGTNHFFNLCNVGANRTFTGSKVLYQVPEGSIIPSPHRLPHPSTQQPLFDFPSIASLIIPRQEFCDRLVTVCINKYRVIGFPVCIESRRYDRNQFIFNLALVLDEDADFSAYSSVIRKLASLFRNLEEQSRFLSNEEEELFKHISKKPVDNRESVELSVDDENGDEGLTHSLSNSLELGGDTTPATKVYALCEMLMEDLNNYCECMIPIGRHLISIRNLPQKLRIPSDDANTINLKLFQTRPQPAPVYPWHVPLATVQLTKMSISSDLTLSRILPFIDGLSSVAQIAQLADTDLSLTRKAVSHLLYYRCVLLLDIFQFSGIYAPTAEIGAFIEDGEAQEEAIRYVSIGHYRRLTDRESDVPGLDKWAWKGLEFGVDKATLVQLYTSLRHGLTLKNWCLEHGILLAGIDVRRFITFGVIRGFLYRVQKYAVVDGGSFNGDNTSIKAEELGADHETTAYWRASRKGSVAGSSIGLDLPLARYLDGIHCFDEVCTELQLSEKRLVEKIKNAYGDVQIIHR